MTDDMSNRTALVTGSGKKRVGAAVAGALAAHGFHIAVHYRTSKAEAESTCADLRTAGVRAEPFAADLASEADVKSLVTRVRQSFGTIDVLVNTAAIWERKPLEEVAAADVVKHFETNALGTFLMCQHVGLEMVGQPGGGCIVNVGDWAVVRPYTGYAAYFPSKGAVDAITRTMAVELGTRNPKVRVNAILPGPVMLPPEIDAAERAEVIAATLVKREGSPEHVAKAVLHFVENDFLTGVLLPVDGGRTMFAG
jgi:pteridine reductase